MPHGKDRHPAGRECWRAHAIHPAALDLTLAPRLESELDEELDCGCEVIDDDADVLHPLDRHLLDGKESP